MARCGRFRRQLHRKVKQNIDGVGARLPGAVYRTMDAKPHVGRAPRANTSQLSWPSGNRGGACFPQLPYRDPYGANRGTDGDGRVSVRRRSSAYAPRLTARSLELAQPVYPDANVGHSGWQFLLAFKGR